MKSLKCKHCNDTVFRKNICEAVCKNCKDNIHINKKLTGDYIGGILKKCLYCDKEMVVFRTRKYCSSNCERRYRLWKSGSTLK